MKSAFLVEDLKELGADWIGAQLAELSWFGKLKEREVWLNEYETLEQARQAIGAYVDRYHHRPHSSLDYRTPLEVRQTWEDLQNIAA